MNSDGHMLGIFPAPYPDEILYSVLCRYHIRNGSPAPMRTNLELWGKKYGKGLFLPDDIESIAGKLRSGAGLSAESFILENTIYPFLKPFTPQGQGSALLTAMKHGEANINNIVGFSKIWAFTLPYLRYCPECVRDDTRVYGEAYWHRLHQLPCTHVCPRHRCQIGNSRITTNMLIREFHPASLVIKPPTVELAFPSDIAEKLEKLADDAQWLLNNGGNLGYYENTSEIYDALLLASKYRDRNGRTYHKQMGAAIIDYYGEEFLSLFNAFKSGTGVWLKILFQHDKMSNNPIHHLLLIRFLAGSAEGFFTGAYNKPDMSFHPFGVEPWPCRNPSCEFYLQDVIAKIDVKVVHGTPRGIFACPYCGFTYRRKKNVPQEKRRAGQIDIVDYGPLWQNRLKERLLAGMSISGAAREMHCDVRKAYELGIKLGILPEGQGPKRAPYIPKGKRAVLPMDEKQRYYRQRWISLLSQYPGASRHELLVADSQCYSWLRVHDRDWFEANSPASKKAAPTWTDQDEDFLGRIKPVIADMERTDNRPVRVTVSSVVKKAGISKLGEKAATGMLPKTNAFLMEHLETPEHWRKRKIVWAIDTLLNQGLNPTTKRIKRIVGINNDDYKKLEDFAAQYTRGRR